MDRYGHLDTPARVSGPVSSRFVANGRAMFERIIAGGAPVLGKSLEYDPGKASSRQDYESEHRYNAGIEEMLPPTHAQGVCIDAR